MLTFQCVQFLKGCDCCRFAHENRIPFRRKNVPLCVTFNRMGYGTHYETVCDFIAIFCMAVARLRDDGKDNCIQRVHRRTQPHSNITTFVISVVSSVNHLINWRVGDGVCSWSNAKLRVFFSVGPLACCESSVFHKLSYISGFCVTVFGKYLSSKYLKLVFRRNLNKEM